jgi:hypothetical protein
MRNHRTLWIGVLVVVTSLIPLQVVEAQTDPTQHGLPGPQIDWQYVDYGFLFESYDHHDRYARFTTHELAVLGQVIRAFADKVGGPQRLSKLVNGPVRVRKDEIEVVSYTQAGRVIGLGRGAFNLALTVEYNYYTWNAKSGDELAQIVFGHEIGHRWIETLRRSTGKDWADVYEANVCRGERISSRETWADAGEVDCEEEAVTNLALNLLGKRYRWTFLHDAPSGDFRQVLVDGWVSDLVAGSR